MADIFRVTSQRQTMNLTADGRFIDVIEVNFETLPNMSPGTVTIPVGQYSADAVSKAIMAQATEMIAVENL